MLANLTALVVSLTSVVVVVVVISGIHQIPPRWCCWRLVGAGYGAYYLMHTYLRTIRVCVYVDKRVSIYKCSMPAHPSVPSKGRDGAVGGNE